jgi:hypothetical protein
MAMGRLTVTVPSELIEAIKDRQNGKSLSSQLSQDLAWYYQVIETGERSIRELFDKEELEVVLAATKGLTWGAGMVGSLIRKTLQGFIEDFCENLHPPSKVAQSTLEKYRNLGGIERLALIDWLTRTHNQEQLESTGTQPLDAAEEQPAVMSEKETGTQQTASVTDDGFVVRRIKRDR